MRDGGILNGALSQVPMKPDANFGVLVPSACHGVPSEVLDTRNTWHDQGEYEARARQLAGLFQANFKNYAANVSPAVRKAGPHGG